MPPRSWQENSAEPRRAARTWQVVLAWLAVSLPLLWGIWQTLKKAAVLFR
jgi:hypothetical protein